MRRQLKPGLLFPYARIAHEKGPGYEATKLIWSIRLVMIIFLINTIDRNTASPFLQNSFLEWLMKVVQAKKLHTNYIPSSYTLVRQIGVSNI